MSQTKTSPSSPAKKYAIAGLRLGIQIYCPTGFVINGEIADEKAMAYLRELGYQLRPCGGVPVFDPVAAAWEEQQRREGFQRNTDPAED